jgi:hypothetical protein
VLVRVRPGAPKKINGLEPPAPSRPQTLLQCDRAVLQCCPQAHCGGRNVLASILKAKKSSQIMRPIGGRTSSVCLLRAAHPAPSGRIYMQRSKFAERPLLYTRRQIARLYGTSVSTIIRLDAEGVLGDPVRLTRKPTSQVFYKAENVLALVDGGSKVKRETPREQSPRAPKASTQLERQSSAKRAR